MNKGVFQSSLVQQMMEGSPTWWSMNNMRPPPELTTFPLLPSSSSTSSWSSSSNSSVPQHQPSNVEMNPWQDCQDLPESWCQLLLGGLMGEEEKYGLNPLHTRKMMENCQDQPDQVLYPPDVSQIDDIKQEYSGGGYVHSRGSEDIQVSKSAWSQILPTSSPRSCITTNFSTNMLDFSNMTRRQRDNSSECNSTETAPAFKKQARVQGSSSPKSTLKVRKEKLGDRITALHQLASPFGKTDTASVLQEAIGYIRFLQSQIEALSSPYLGSGLSSGNMKQQAAAHQQGNTSCLFSSEAHGQEVDDDEEKKKKDLRSRGLCVVPVSFTMHVKYGSDNCEINNGADFWAPSALGGSGF